MKGFVIKQFYNILGSQSLFEKKVSEGIVYYSTPIQSLHSLQFPLKPCEPTFDAQLDAQ